ncbi:unnamed protein product [Rotaria sp. Silwood2]|nr:unnamed protein product [Rotaria sp. Silwood2]
MHSARPVVDIIAHSSADQIISCGADLIIRIWRVFPYAVESLSVVRSIFCALPPIHLTIVKNSLAVAFREESTLTHSLMVYNLENNERFDHLPENDHCDKISAISGCSKLKLIATGSLDGTLRIWNGKNQLIRMIVIHDNIHSLHFSNESGDLILGISDHLYKMHHSSYLPKAIIFKTISMEFKPIIPEIKESEETDNTQLTRMSSADLIRLKRAHKAEKMPLNIIPENVDISAFHAKSVEQMKLKTQELEKLEKRDLEIAQIAEGKIHRTKKYKISSKVRKEAFNEYMKIYLKEPKKGLLDDDMYKLTEQELFGPPITKSDPYVIQKDDDGFFPSVKEANQDPLSKLYEERQQKLSELQEHYRDQPPFPNDDIRIIKQQQDKYELKKLLSSNFEKITLPSDRPQYGPGAIVPNSVLAKLLWPNRQPKKQEREEWLPPVLSEEQLQALEKTAPGDEEAEWKELIEATMKKKLATDEEDMDDRLEKQKKKTQSDFMKQLTDLAQQVYNFFFFYLNRWTRAFRTHIEEMHVRLKNGDVHAQISNATSRALTGDTSLSTRAAVNGKNLTVTLDALPRLITSNISSMEVINYFVEITQDQINDRNQPREKPDNNTILVLPKINKQTALVRLGESHTDFHRPIKRNPIYLPHEHRFEPGELSMGRCVNYPVRKLFLDPFRRQIFTEDIEYEDTEPYLLTLKLAPKYFLPILSQVAKT